MSLQTDYLEVSRRWSVLRLLTGGPLATYAASFTPSVQGTTQFFLRWPMGVVTQVRPFFVLEKSSGVRTGNTLGNLSRQNRYVLSILAAQMTNAVGDAGPDILLDVLTEKIIPWLHGRRIPFYDYSVPATPVAVPSLDFVLFYERDARESEKGDRDRNVLTIEWTGTF